MSPAQNTHYFLTLCSTPFEKLQVGNVLFTGTGRSCLCAPSSQVSQWRGAGSEQHCAGAANLLMLFATS